MSDQDNKLELIVKESGLEQTKANIILEKFKDYFNLASIWEIKAKTIIVTQEDQRADMQMARIGRLELREKRIAIENTRKELKEQSLREGKAIDGIANVLKALIVPIEEYLEKQENFVKIKAEAENQAKLIEYERKVELERIAKEKADKEEQERIKAENDRLKKEAEIAEAQRMADKKKADDEVARIKSEAEAEAEKIRIEAAKVMAEKQAENDRLEKELQAKKDAEAKAIADEQKRIEALKSASDQEKILKLVSDLKSINLPEVTSIDSINKIKQVKVLLEQIFKLL